MRLAFALESWEKVYMSNNFLCGLAPFKGVGK